LEVAPHPAAHHLWVCRVETGRGDPRTIVCGAANVAVGQLVAVALPGAVLAGGRRIEAADIRGVRSDGMICSAGELGLPEDVAGDAAGGILVLDEGRPGDDVRPLLDLDDAILVLDLTPNYAAHCQSILGVAREVAALTGSPLHPPDPGLAVVPPGDGAPPVTVVVEDVAACRRYAARVVEGFRIGTSPLWLRCRLVAAGMRPVVNVVDVTNLVMLELGQPLHAFDLDRLHGTVRVRRALAGERLVTLDGVERELAEGDLVIADDGGPVAIAGVMGGLATEVRSETRRVLIESAWFDPGLVGRTSRRLGLRSEAAGRFEKGVDPSACLAAADRAAALMVRLAGGGVH
ncbi:MAG: phenylalanine--tRNA ligase subunit beta, partial [Clostridia bacterium]|nr:phenylalanine--tRNA ligase subunit beta [Clostridia bacterium]